jgi:DNA polymerase-3 subunit delta'
MKLIGHQKQWELLQKITKLGKIPHAFLFYGEEAIGKKKLALEFIKLLDCQSSSSRPCQDCRSCQDIEKNASPDLVIVEPEEGEIKIGQIRELHKKLALRSYAAPFKAAIINQAHCMNQEAQSAFLKLLEEPKGQTILILVSEYPEALLPTILSRLETLKVSPLLDTEIEDYLKSQKVPVEKIKQLIFLASGKPGRVIAFLGDPAKQAEYEKLIKEIGDLGNLDLAERFRYAEKLTKDQGDLKEVLDIWLGYFRGLLLSSVKNPSKEYPTIKLQRILKLTQSISQLISTTNINSRLALEVLMLEL